MNADEFRHGDAERSGQRDRAGPVSLRAMPRPPTAAPPKPDLPRLVEQVRILLWMQMHLTLIALLGLLLYLGIASAVLDEDEVDQGMVTMLALVATAVALAVCAKLVRRRWPWVWFLILATEAAVVVIVVRAVTGGVTGLLAHRDVGTSIVDFLVTDLLALLYVTFTAWIIVDMFRREMRAYLFRLDG